ncbi:hypothetical protein JZ751_010194, partial [Albula glossodonta]
ETAVSFWLTERIFHMPPLQHRRLSACWLKGPLFASEIRWKVPARFKFITPTKLQPPTPQHSLSQSRSVSLLKDAHWADVTVFPGLGWLQQRVLHHNNCAVVALTLERHGVRLLYISDPSGPNRKEDMPSFVFLARCEEEGTDIRLSFSEQRYEQRLGERSVSIPSFLEENEVAESSPGQRGLPTAGAETMGLESGRVLKNRLMKELRSSRAGRVERAASLLGMRDGQLNTGAGMLPIKCSSAEPRLKALDEVRSALSLAVSMATWGGSTAQVEGKAGVLLTETASTRCTRHRNNGVKELCHQLSARCTRHRNNGVKELSCSTLTIVTLSVFKSAPFASP